MNGFMKGMFFILLVMYVVSPVDFVPGPIDDIIAIFAYALVNRNSGMIGGE